MERNGGGGRDFEGHFENWGCGEDRKSETFSGKFPVVKGGACY